jgi:3-carboxy-cis,cis-muconate cycloisomerase
MPVNPADGPVLGTLYGSDAMRAVFAEQKYFQRMLDVEAALARVQAKLGIIPAQAGEAITRAARVENLDTAELAAAARNVGYPVVGLVAGLSRAAGEWGGWTHWGATTQDIMDSATVLQIRDGLFLVRAELRAILAALLTQAEKHRATVMAGRTHLQHALPITFGLKCATWAQPLIAHLRRLEELRPRVEVVEFGGAAGTLASLGDQGLGVAEALADELGLGTTPAPWHVCRDGFAETVCFLGLVCGSLTKIATDVILLAQNEVAELAEPYVAGRGASSTMPQKRNPISSVYITAQSAMVKQLVAALLEAMVEDHERSTGPWEIEWIALPEIFMLSAGALAQTRFLVEGLQVNEKKMRDNLDITKGLIMSEAVMMGLGAAMGRNRAHDVVYDICREVVKTGRPLIDLLAEDKEIGKHATRKQLEQMVDPANYLGVAGEMVDRVLAMRKKS